MGKNYYRLNPEKYYAKKQERRGNMRAWMIELKSKLSCEECGENHPATLHFHHKDPASKEFSIANGLHRGFGKKRILAEMDKCVVLCANCHLKHHAAVI